MTDAPMIPDLSAILIDRDAAGHFVVEPHVCPLGADRARTFPNASDALDYADALAAEAGTSVCLMCDLGS